MIHKQFYFGKEGREKIIETTQMVGDVLGKTLGPAGRNYFLPTGITNDGRTIMSELRFKDEGKDQASLAFHEVARQTDKDAGDGTTTSIVLACKLTQDLLEKVPDIDTPIPGQISVMTLSKQLDEEKNKVLKLLNEKVKKVETKEDLYKVALTSMEHPEGAKIISDAIWEAGKDSYPVLDTGVNEKIETDVVDGVRFPLKIAYLSMLKGKQISYENVAVLVVNHAFEQYLELGPFMASMIQAKPKIGCLLIVAKTFSTPFVGQVSEVSSKTKLPIVLVSSNLHADTFEDIASYVDATVFDTHPKTGKKITQLNRWEYSGFTKKIVVTENDVTFIKGNGKEAIFKNEKVIHRVQERVDELKKQLETEKDEKEKLQIERRIAALSGGIVTIYVDAKTDAEKYYLKLKAEDCMNSCRAALNDGIVEGGGTTLRDIANVLGEDSLLYGALKEPYERIVRNNLGQEFDTKEVWDAFAVVKAGVENSISVVKVLITLEGIIADVSEDAATALANKILSA